MDDELDNPLPMMNPWLQAYWQSIHARIITYVCDQISDQLPSGLAALTEERVEIEDLTGGPNRVAGPDVSLHDTGVSNATPTAVAEPLPHDELVVEILDEPVERFIHIVSNSGELITAIEIISPSNTRGRGLDSYLAKQRSFQTGGVNLVEVYLLRDEAHPLIRKPVSPAPYGISIWRGADPEKVQGWIFHRYSSAFAKNSNSPAANRHRCRSGSPASDRSSLPQR